MHEEWKSCHIGLGVEVSSLGNVRRNGRPRHTGHKAGDYTRLQLQVAGRKMVFDIHRLMAFAFFGPPPEGKPLAAHRNDIRDDNRIENIYWASPKDNASDGKHNGGLAIGERVGTAKLTTLDVLEIRRLHHNDRISYRRLAKMFRVCPNTINLIVKRMWWKHL